MSRRNDELELARLRRALGMVEWVGVTGEWEVVKPRWWTRPWTRRGERGFNVKLRRARGKW